MSNFQQPSRPWITSNAAIFPFFQQVPTRTRTSVRPRARSCLQTTTNHGSSDVCSLDTPTWPVISWFLEPVCHPLPATHPSTQPRRGHSTSSMSVSSSAEDVSDSEASVPSSPSQAMEIRDDTIRKTFNTTLWPPPSSPFSPAPIHLLRCPSSIPGLIGSDHIWAWCILMGTGAGQRVIIASRSDDFFPNSHWRQPRSRLPTASSVQSVSTLSHVSMTPIGVIPPNMTSPSRAPILAGRDTFPRSDYLAPSLQQRVHDKGIGDRCESRSAHGMALQARHTQKQADHQERVGESRQVEDPIQRPTNGHDYEKGLTSSDIFTKSIVDGWCTSVTRFRGLSGPAKPTKITT